MNNLANHCAIIKVVKKIHVLSDQGYGLVVEHKPCMCEDLGSSFAQHIPPTLIGTRYGSIGSTIMMVI